MKISTKGRYALRLMIDLAEHDHGEYIPLKEISSRQNVSVKYLEQIAGVLGKAGFLRSGRGAQGGYRLTRDPVKYLEQIVNQLSRAGLLRSVRGAQGGYRLAKDAEEYTAGVILRVTEGGLAPIACLTESAEICPRNSTCETLDFWVGLGKAIDSYVDSVSLEDLVLQHQKKLENQG